jgi:polyisoprenoid-binding protein YceI
MTTVPQTTEPEVLAPGIWNADSAHSRVEFAVDYLGGTFRGAFSPFEAQLRVTEDGEATLTGVARAESVRVQDENLEAHLLSPEFFDEERTPELTFRSTAIRTQGNAVEIDGELTVRGTRQPVHLTGTVRPPIGAYGQQRTGISVQTTVDRTAFGLNWNAPLDDGSPALANDVLLTAELFLIKE